VIGITGSDAFEIDFTVTADQGASRGDLFRLQSSFVVSVDANGELQFRGWTTAGKIFLQTSGANLDDLSAHDVSITLENDVLSLTVDGTVLASTSMTGTLTASGRHDLYIGNPWGANFDSTISDLSISYAKDSSTWVTVSSDGSQTASDQTSTTTASAVQSDSLSDSVLTGFTSLSSTDTSTDTGTDSGSDSSSTGLGGFSFTRSIGTTTTSDSDGASDIATLIQHDHFAFLTWGHSLSDA